MIGENHGLFYKFSRFDSVFYSFVDTCSILLKSYRYHKLCSGKLYSVEHGINIANNCPDKSQKKQADNGTEKTAADRTEDDSGDCTNDGEAFLGFEIFIALAVVMVIVIASGHNLILS